MQIFLFNNHYSSELLTRLFSSLMRLCLISCLTNCTSVATITTDFWRDDDGLRGEAAAAAEEEEEGDYDYSIELVVVLLVMGG